MTAVTQDSIARELHERFASDHLDHWDRLDEFDRRQSLYWDMAEIILAGPCADAYSDGWAAYDQWLGEPSGIDAPENPYRQASMVSGSEEDK